MAYGILVHWPGIEPTACAVELQRTTGPPGKSLDMKSFMKKVENFTFTLEKVAYFTFLKHNVWLNKKQVDFCNWCDVTRHVAFGKLQVVRVWEGKGQIISYYYYKCNFYIMELLKIYPVSSKVSRAYFENTKFIVSFPLQVMIGWLGITNKYSTHIHIYTPCIFYKNYNFSGN